MAKPKTAPAPARGLIRQLHIWLSVFVAPSLLFFALTGALQTFRIPDQKEAPVVLQKLARLHKDDVFAVKPPRPKKPDAAGARDGGDHPKGDHAGRDHDKGDKAAAPPEGKAPEGKGPEGKKPPPKPSTEVLKWFFAIVSVVIAITTLLGVWMAVAYSRQKVLIWILLIAGTVAPILILAI